MKRIIFLSLCCVAALSLTDCGSSSSKDGEEKISETGGNQKESYRDAVKNNDFETAHEILDEIYDEFLDTWESNYNGLSYYNDLRATIELSATKYSLAASYVLCAEARYIISNYPNEALDRIAYLFNEIRIMGEKSDEYHTGGSEECQQECAKVDCYKQTVKYNNELCDVVLNLALLHHNKQLAELALLYYRENGRESYGDMYWSYDDKEAAQKKYDEAVANGTFND